VLVRFFSLLIFRVFLPAVRDAVTPNQDFIICQHPHSRNLFIAGGGSFHGWKFMANIGRYVVQMLEGTLDEEKERRWAWDRSNDGGACSMYIPARDLKDIQTYNRSCSIAIKGRRIIILLVH
jgi:sarcosine oxidase/L-pipecolate oxidase